MSNPVGVRDGDFMRFQGWDLPGNDVANYEGYRGNITRLKELVTKRPTSAFYAFNSQGWIKSLTSIDRSSFRQASNSDLYVRVEYPGWAFYQGMNHRGNDLYRIEEMNTPPSLMVKIDARTASGPEGPMVAAFNTLGEVKSKIEYPLGRWTGQSPTSLDGLYVRTDFDSYNYFSRRNSPQNNIENATTHARDVPAIIKASEAADVTRVVGFNTMGWIKDRIEVPPPILDDFKEDTEGIYVRTEWPGFVYLPGVVSPGNDIRQVTGKSLPELIQEARNDAQVVAFNTNGWMKSDVAGEPATPAQPQPLLFGTYVKVRAASQSEGRLDNNLALKISLFLLKGTVAIWAFWVLPDSSIRLQYQKGVSEACKEITEYVAQGKLSIADAAQKAFDMRQQYLVWARQKSSTLGAIFATATKPANLKIDKYLDYYSQKLFQKSYAQVTSSPEQAQVMTALLQSAGRANPKVNLALKGAGLLSKAAVPIAVAFSLVSVAMAPHWEAELAYQISSWSRAIFLRSFTIETGRLYSPAGAILGGIAGTIVATVIDEDMFPNLIDWFYGGSSRSSAVEILDNEFQLCQDAVTQRMKTRERTCHVHQIYAGQLSALRDSPPGAEKSAESIISIGDSPSVDEVLIATIVWTGLEPVTAYNTGNPGDLINLIGWISKNLPEDSC